MRILENITKAGTWESESRNLIWYRSRKQFESKSDVGKQETQDVVESMWRRERESCKKG